MEKKFRMKIDPYTFAADLRMMDDFETLPVMHENLSLEELRGFYRKLAKKLGAEVIE